MTETSSCYVTLTTLPTGDAHLPHRRGGRLGASPYYRDAPDLVLLVIDTERVRPELRYEQVPGQPDPYPHIYGSLNLDAVLETRPFQPPAPGP